MRAYRTATGALVATQEEARGAGRGWQREDIPDDKAGLLAFINGEREKGAPGGNVTPPAPLDLPAVPDPAPPPPPPPAPPPVNSAESALAFIGECEAGSVPAIVEAALGRLGELGEGARPALAARIGRANPACRWGAGTSLYRGAAALALVLAFD